jgi:hypothetical protein
MTYLKDTITWFVFSGLSIGIFVAMNNLEHDFWKTLILKTLTIIALVEIIIFNSFSLIKELIIVLIITPALLINEISKSNESYDYLHKRTNAILGIFAIFIVSYSLYRLITETDSIGYISYIKSFLFPVIYSIISIPYMYFLILFVGYNHLFQRLKSGNKLNKKLTLLLKLRVLRFCNISHKKLKCVGYLGNTKLMSISSKDEIDGVFEKCRDVLSQDESHKSE